MIRIIVNSIILSIICELMRCLTIDKKLYYYMYMDYVCL